MNFKTISELKILKLAHDVLYSRLLDERIWLDKTGSPIARKKIDVLEDQTEEIELRIIALEGDKK